MRLLFLMPLLFCMMVVQAQQIETFGHYYYNQSQFNPAANAARYDLHVSSLHRRYWSNSGVTPTQTLVQAEKYMSQLHGAIGINFEGEQFGGYRIQRYGLAYAGRINMGTDSHLQLGIQGTFLASRLITGNQYDNYKAADLNVGIFYTNEKMRVGLSSTQVTEPAIFPGSVFPLELIRLYYVTGSYEVAVGPGHIEPSMRVVSDGSFTALDINLNTYVIPKILIGGGIRLNEAFILNGGFVRDDFRILYLYESQMTKLTNFGGPTHELGVAFTIQ